VNAPDADDARDQRLDSTDRWALTAQLPPEPGQPTPTLVTGRLLDPGEFADVGAANALLRHLTGGSAYQRLHQAFELLGQHAQRARTRAASLPQPSLQREIARIDQAVGVTLTAADALLDNSVNDLVADYGPQSQQATIMREAVDEAKGRLPVALVGPLLALPNSESSLVEMQALPSDRSPADGEPGVESREPSWEPVLREPVVASLIAAIGPAAASLTEAPVRVVSLLQQLVLACESLFARHLLLREDRIVTASLRLRRLAAEVLDGAPVLTSTGGDPAQPQIRFTELALGEVHVLQRALRQARRVLSPPVAQAARPSPASPEGSATATQSTSEGEGEATNHAPTTEGAAAGAPEAESTGPASAVDLVAVVEHVSRLTVSAERAWSAALDPDALGEANPKLLDQWHSLMEVIRRQAELSSRALGAAGLDATVDQYPPDVAQLLMLDLDPDLERRRRQLQLAQFYALEQLLTALQGLQQPSRTALDPRTGQTTETWWDSGAFALVRARARHLARVTLALLNAEHAAIAAAASDEATVPGQAHPQAEPPPWWPHLRLGAEALGRGDVEATLLHAHLSLTARFGDTAFLPDAVAAPFGEKAESEAAQALVAKLEEAIEQLAVGAGVDLGVAVPLAHALLPLVEHLLLPVPMTSSPASSEAEAVDGLGSAASPDHPSQADPNAPQADK
jgi:hypothetical protein